MPKPHRPPSAPASTARSAPAACAAVLLALLVGLVALTGCAGSDGSRGDRLSIGEFERRLEGEGLSVKRLAEAPGRFPSASSAEYRVSTDLVEVYELPPGFSASLNADELEPPPSKELIYYQRGNLIVVQRGGFSMVRTAVTRALAGR